MKLFVSVALTLLALVSGQSFAEQSTVPAEHAAHDAVSMRAAHEKSPFDFNHRGAGSDKSDELGVPYYNQHNL